MFETVKRQKPKNMREINLNNGTEKKVSVTKNKRKSLLSLIIPSLWILFCSTWIMLSITNGKIFLAKILISSFIISAVLFSHGFQLNHPKNNSTKKKENF